jgi:hypothetical protein
VNETNNEFGQSYSQAPSNNDNIHNDLHQDTLTHNTNNHHNHNHSLMGLFGFTNPSPSPASFGMAAGNPFEALISSLSETLMSAGGLSPSSRPHSRRIQALIQNGTTDSLFSDLPSEVRSVQTTCPITRTDFADDSEIRRINGCGHVFSREALGRWLDNHTTCPSCRFDIVTEEGLPQQNNVPADSVGTTGNQNLNQNQNQSNMSQQSTNAPRDAPLDIDRFMASMFQLPVMDITWSTDNAGNHTYVSRTIDASGNWTTHESRETNLNELALNSALGSIMQYDEPDEDAENDTDENSMSDGPPMAENVD